MSKQTLLGTLAGFVVGAIFLNVVPARAVVLTTDVITDAVLAAMQTAVTGAISAMESNVTDAITGISNPNSISSLLRGGFTQNANYAKAQVGAQQQITDASNTAMARFHRDVRNSQIRDEHTANTQHCAALDTGQVTEAAAVMGWRTAQSIEATTDPRGEALSGTPASTGYGQAMQAAGRLHMERYCSESEADAGLCTVSTKANFDQRASSLFGADNLGDIAGVSVANDYAANLVQPVPPAALTGDQLKTPEGQDMAARRRSYNARMSLARNMISYAIGVQTPAVQLTAAEKQLLQNEGITVPTSGSWLQVMSLEASRRISDTGWAASLQTMPPASVEREVAVELAMNNYIAFENYRLSLMHLSLDATRLASGVEHDFNGVTEMPAPSPASN